LGDNLVYVRYSFSPHLNLKAEVNALSEAMIEFDHEKAQIITDNPDHEEMIKEKK
jgi:hypothetical protein